MSDLISRQAVDDVIYDYSRSCDVDYAQIMEYIDKIPSVDIIDHARAIKDYCDKTRCEECELAEHKVMNETDNYLCRVHYLRPECWDLPEGEKE